MADANPAPAADAEAAPPKKSSKLLVIIIAAVVVLGLAGGGAYFFMQGEDAEAATAKDKKEHKAAAKGPAMYVKLDPPFVVNFESKGMMRFLQVSVEVMTRDQATAEMLKLHDPMLRNDLLLLLGNQTYDTISTREGKERLRTEALQAIAKVIEKEGGTAKSVEELYFTSFVMQ